MSCRKLACFLVAVSVASVVNGQMLTTFDYLQTDVSTGSGTIAAPAPSDVGGVTITWTDTAMPVAGVRDPAGGGSAGGVVGTFDMENGSAGPNGLDVALYWNGAAPDPTIAPDPISVDILGTGSDGNDYSMNVPLVFWGDPSALDTSGDEQDVEPFGPPERERIADERVPGWGTNDYQWELEYQTTLGGLALPRTAMWLSPTWANGNTDFDGDGIIDTGGRAQRYTQNENELGSEVPSPQINTDTTSGAEKDAMDGDGQDANCDMKIDIDGNGTFDCTAAIGLPLEFGFGWRDRDFLDPGDSVFVDNFNVRGLLEYDVANITNLGGGNGGGGLACDGDGDGDCQLDDIAAFYAAAGSSVAAGSGFDSDGDGTIGPGDLAGWLAAASTADNLANPSARTINVGDADLDFDVDSTDLGLLLNNFGSSAADAASGAGWNGGDMDMNGTVDSTDLGLLLNNFGTEGATSQVPEPGSVVLMLLAGLGLLGMRRRK